MSKPTYEELAAQVEVLRTQITKAREYLSHVDVNSACVMLAVALESTPAACLSQVRADAIEGALNSIVAMDMSDLNYEFIDGYEYCRALIYQHCESIRQGGDV